MPIPEDARRRTERGPWAIGLAFEPNSDGRARAALVGVDGRAKAHSLSVRGYSGTPVSALTSAIDTLLTAAALPPDAPLLGAALLTDPVTRTGARMAFPEPRERIVAALTEIFGTAPVQLIATAACQEAWLELPQRPRYADHPAVVAVGPLVRAARAGTAATSVTAGRETAGRVASEAALRSRQRTQQPFLEVTSPGELSLLAALQRGEPAHRPDDAGRVRRRG